MLQPDPQTDIRLFVPHAVAADHQVCDLAIDACREYAAQGLKGGFDRSAFGNFIRRRVPGLPEHEGVLDALFELSRGLAAFIERRRDTIQAYVLKNMLKPIFLRGQFDVLMGNPPWLSFRYLRTPDYQAEVQALFEHYALTWKGHLATHMELATLFLVRCADWYLAGRGLVGFVLPRSVFSADQHHRFRAGEFGRVHLSFVEAWDLHKVQVKGAGRIFRVPPAVVIAVKDTEAVVGYPIPGLRFSGQLSRHNAGPEEADDALSAEETDFDLHHRGERSFLAAPSEDADPGASAYRPAFRNGATLYPRAFWFVEVVKHPVLGASADTPMVRTDPEVLAQPKPPWRDICLQAPVESQFLYHMVLGSDIVPFGLLGRRLVVLPLEPEGDHYTLLDASALAQRGCQLMREWMLRAEAIWVQGRGSKADRMTIYQRLDAYHGLTSQLPEDGWRVTYATSGMHVCAATLAPGGVPRPIVESSAYAAAVWDAGEAHYLVAALNAGTVDALLKPAQARGEFNPRHIHKKVFDVAPIPQFDPDNDLHCRLAELGAACAEKVQAWIVEETAGNNEAESRAKVAKLRRAIGHARNRVRKMLAPELAQIDELVRELLGL
jgi:hypothetical protein